MMLTHTLRFKVLKQMLLEGVSHTVTSRKRHNQQIHFPAGTSTLRSEAEVTDIIQIMVDRDTECYKRNWIGEYLANTMSINFYISSKTLTSKGNKCWYMGFAPK